MCPPVRNKTSVDEQKTGFSKAFPWRRLHCDVIAAYSITNVLQLNHVYCRHSFTQNPRQHHLLAGRNDPYF